jgi:hypothetical protein
MEPHEKAHYSCLCIVCHRLIEFPVCNECLRECEQVEREWFERQKAANRRKDEG